MTGTTDSYYLAGECKACGTTVWANLDGSCVNGHPDTSITELRVAYPERLRTDTLMTLMQGSEDKRWVEGGNLAMTGSPREAFDHLSAIEPTVTNPVDLHFTYNGLIDATYRLRDEDAVWLEWCIEYCKRDVELFPRFRSGWVADERLRHLFSAAMLLEVGDQREGNKELKAAAARIKFDLLVPSFKQLAIIYEKQGRYAEALDVAKSARTYGLSDRTQGDYAGRIDRLKRKLAG